MTFIEAKGLGFSYRGTARRQLADVSVEIPAGSRVAVMGATGSGKSTFALALAGLIPHHHPGDLYGTLRVAGVLTHETTLPDLIRRVGLVAQDPESQLMGRRVLDDTAIGPANLGLPRTEVWARATQALTAVGLADLADREVATLSGGQQQRLAVAGVLAMDPPILVLDEAASELDPEGAAAIHRLAETRCAAGQTVVLIDHDSDVVAAWAEFLLVLDEGRPLFFGPPSEFFRDGARVTAAGLRQPASYAIAEAATQAGLLAASAGTDPAVLLDAVHPLAVGISPPSSPETPAATSPALELTDLTHRYPNGVAALDRVSATIHHGEFVALLGGNGAGKSTLARHLVGLLRPTSGTVRINARDIADRPTAELAAEVGFVFQNPDHQIFADTVYDEVAFGLRNLSLPEVEISQRVAATLAQVGLAEAASRHPLRLSRGERQRVAVASVLVMRPGILVIDEPTTGLDWRGAAALLELVADLHRAGHTVVIITHDLLLAARYATRALVLAEGRLALNVPFERLFDDEDRLASLRLKAPAVVRVARRLGLPPATTPEDVVAAWRQARDAS
ncbi:MAG: ABC transporter ATP-binding protein [Propionibacteriaceae bacterium]|nr:ABC transporter ATP-binding protein [Propionibacteriaceae bacterium]